MGSRCPRLHHVVVVVLKCDVALAQVDAPFKDVEHRVVVVVVVSETRPASITRELLKQ